MITECWTPQSSHRDTFFLYISCLIDHWVDCALHIECMHGIIGNFEHIKCNWNLPKSIAYNGCHRYDQATINLLIVKYFGKKRADEIGEDGKKNFRCLSSSFC